MEIKDFAVCFSGQPRCLENGYKDFKKLFEGLELDIFAHIWQSDYLLSGWGHNMGWENKQTKVYKAQEFVDMYRPTDYLIEDYSTTDFFRNTIYQPGYRNPINKVWSSYSQFYSIMKSFEVMNKYEEKNNIKYKYVIKYRMDHDVDFENSDINWDKMKKRLDEEQDLILVNPGYDWPNGNGVSNLLAIGTCESMYKYSRAYDYYPWLVKNCPFPDYDEANLKYYIEKVCGLRIESTAGISVGVYR